MLSFETGDFYIEIFLLAISPSNLREGPEGLMSILLLYLGRCLIWVSKIASFSDSDNKSNALLMENTSLINSIPRYQFAFLFQGQSAFFSFFLNYTTYVSPLQYIYTSFQSYISNERLGPLMEKYDKNF